MSDLYFSGELEELDAVCLLMKDGYEDHYDPIITYKRKPHCHQDIDVVEYTDYDHETIWENK